MSKFESKFDLLQKVAIDRTDICGVVVGISFSPPNVVEVLVSWFSNGVHYKEYFHEARLSPT